MGSLRQPPSYSPARSYAFTECHSLSGLSFIWHGLGGPRTSPCPQPSSSAHELDLWRLFGFNRLMIQTFLFVCAPLLPQFNPANPQFIVAKQC